jgi:hypothetical protein
MTTCKHGVPGADKQDGKSELCNYCRPTPKKLKITPMERYRERVVRCGVYKKHQNGDTLTLKDLKKGLPGMPWAGKGKDLKPLNIGQDAENWGKLWTSKETIKLKELFDFYGFADAEKWAEIAKDNFGRTLYGIEQQLRFVASGEDWIFEAVVERRNLIFHTNWYDDLCKEERNKT